MSDGLAVQPVITITAALQKASSACCEAKLNPGQEPETFTCRKCGGPAERVMSDPQESTHGTGKAGE